MIYSYTFMNARKCERRSEKKERKCECKAVHKRVCACKSMRGSMFMSKYMREWVGKYARRIVQVCVVQVHEI